MIYEPYHIQYTYGDVFRIKPLGDSHIDSTTCDKKALIAYLEDSDDKTYLLGLGDLADLILPKDIKRYQKEEDGTKGSAVADEAVDMLEEFFIKYYHGQYLGFMLGNHEYSVLKYHGSHVSRRLARRLNTKSLGIQCMLNMFFREENGRGRKLRIYAHHGFGGNNRSYGGNITKFSNHAQAYEADLCFYGHVHGRDIKKLANIRIINNEIVSEHKWVFICGGFKKVFHISDVPTFEELRGFNPNSIGCYTVSVQPDHKWFKISSDI